MENTIVKLDKREENVIVTYWTSTLDINGDEDEVETEYLVPVEVVIDHIRECELDCVGQSDVDEFIYESPYATLRTKLDYVMDSYLDSNGHPTL